MKIKPLVILFLTLFIVFTASTITISRQRHKVRISAVEPGTNLSESAGFKTFLKSKYNQIGLAQTGLDSTVFYKAVTGYFNLRAENKLNEEKAVVTVIDFSKPSVEKRLWVIDLKENKVLYHTLVAHGRNTGENEAKCFSNRCQSNMSSLGFYVTNETYTGKHGLSLHIDGMEDKFNSNARERAVVVHGANYVSEDFINNVGRLGRSEGCPALPEDIAPEVIQTIANGTALFIYFPDKKYEASTHYYNTKQAAAAFIQDQQIGLN